MGTGDMPEDILAAAEVAEYLLDEEVHEMKSGEAANINNAGGASQVEYLRECGMTWSHLRMLLNVEDPE